MSTTAEPEPGASPYQPAQLHRQPWPFHHCPTCGHEEFQVASHWGDAVFSCRGCHRSWRFVLGYLQELPGYEAGSGGGLVGAESRIDRAVDLGVTRRPLTGQG